MNDTLSYREVVGILQLLRGTKEFRRVDAQVGGITLSVQRMSLVPCSVHAEQRLGIKSDVRAAGPIDARRRA